MRFQGFLLGLVTIMVVLMALANLDSSGQVGAINLPFLGTYAMPTRLIGLLTIVLVALAFWFAASMLSTSARAHRADDLKRIDDLRSSLDSQEASRFATLQSSLDAHVRAIMARLETIRPPEGSPLASSLAAPAESTSSQVSLNTESASQGSLLEATDNSSAADLVRPSSPRQNTRTAQTR